MLNNIYIMPMVGGLHGLLLLLSGSRHQKQFEYYNSLYGKGRQWYDTAEAILQRSMSHGNE